MWIMVAGPYSHGANSQSDRDNNLLALNLFALELLSRGHLPVIGVNMALPLISAAGPAVDAGAIMDEVSLALVDRCDAVLRVGGQSRGADAEVARFRLQGKPVYFDVADIPSPLPAGRHAPPPSSRIVPNEPRRSFPMTQAPDSIPSRPLGLTITSFNPAFSDNPHELLDELRENAPVAWDSLLQRVVLTRAADVEAVLRDRDLMVDGRKAPEGTFMRMVSERRLPSGRVSEPSMLTLDPPDHDRLRALVNKAFTPRAVAAIEPRVREIAAELLDAVEGRDEWDLIGEFSAPLPTIVIAEMLGVDPHMQKQFKTWSDCVVQSFNPFLGPEKGREIEAAIDDLGAYLRETIAERRANRGDDLITALIDAEENGEQLNDQEIVTMVVLLLLAGNLTTTDLVGNGMLAFLTHRDQWELLKSRPELLANAVEEMLRFDPPVVQSGRLSLKEMEVGGCPVHAGQTISPMLLAANHDPALNPNPHAFDISREDIHHTSFGGGRRYCLGAPLARLEARVALEALVDRFPDLQLATDKPQWRNVPVFRGLVALPVKPR